MSRTLVMGVVNVTPDSFSDGGRWFNADAAVAHGITLIEQGADLLDIGGESTGRAPHVPRRTKNCVASCRWFGNWPPGSR